MDTFYLGSHETSWLARTDRPLFLSRRRLERRKTLPRALGRWALDSGGFTELSMYGRWQTSPAAYVEQVARYADEIGQLDFAAPMDWMCEPHMIERTGLSVREHQERTVANYLDLRAMAPNLPIIPVLQGWDIDDYPRCVELYQQAGVDLSALPLVGLGSVCRRQHTGQIAHLVSSLSQFQLHGFGVKTGGLGQYGYLLASADSLAWSYRARNSDPLPGCTHQTCANCMRFALRWRDRLLTRLDGAHVQPSLFDYGSAA